MEAGLIGRPSSGGVRYVPSSRSALSGAIESMEYRVPFNRPYMTGRELDLMAEAYHGLTISEGGPFTARCEAALKEALGAPAVLLTSSCTHALEVAALLLDVGPGDEIIVPSFTFASTANAFAMRGGVRSSRTSVRTR